MLRRNHIGKRNYHRGRIYRLASGLSIHQFLRVGLVNFIIDRELFPHQYLPHLNSWKRYESRRHCYTRCYLWWKGTLWRNSSWPSAKSRKPRSWKSNQFWIILPQAEIDNASTLEEEEYILSPLKYKLGDKWIELKWDTGKIFSIYRGRISGYFLRTTAMKATLMPVFKSLINLCDRTGLAFRSIV